MIVAISMLAAALLIAVLPPHWPTDARPGHRRPTWLSTAPTNCALCLATLFIWAWCGIVAADEAARERRYWRRRKQQEREWDEVLGEVGV